MTPPWGLPFSGATSTPSASPPCLRNCSNTPKHPAITEALPDGCQEGLVRDVVEIAPDIHVHDMSVPAGLLLVADVGQRGLATRGIMP